MRAQSLDRRMFRRDPQMVDFDEEVEPGKTPILCNKYALDDMEERSSPGGPRGIGGGSDGRFPVNPRSQSMPRQSRYGDRLMPDRMPYYNEENEMAMQAARKQPLPPPGKRRDLRPG